jgi:hypothetical protein
MAFLLAVFHRALTPVHRHRSLEGFEHLEKTDLLGLAGEGESASHAFLGVNQPTPDEKPEDLSEKRLRERTVLGDFVDLSELPALGPGQIEHGGEPILTATGG